MAPRDDEPTAGARLKAARQLAGFKTPKELADAIDEKGFGARTLIAIEQGTREMQPRERSSVARACGLPEGFFTAPLSSLGPAEAEVGETLSLAEQLAEHDAIEQLLEGHRVIGEELARIGERQAALRDDLVRSEVIKPRAAATPQQRAAIRRLGGAGRRDDPDQRAQRSGRS